MKFNFFRSFRKTRPSSSVNYEDTAAFVNENITEIKTLLSSFGYNNRHRRLHDLSQMAGCHVLLLCRRDDKQSDKYKVVESSDANFAVVGREFRWQYSQPAASSDAETILVTLPFPKIGAKAFISVPIKNATGVVVGLLFGLSLAAIPHIDEKTQLLHLMSPLFETEILLEEYKKKDIEYEQRINSLRQTIEIQTNELNARNAADEAHKEAKHNNSKDNGYEYTSDI